MSNIKECRITNPAGDEDVCAEFIIDANEPIFILSALHLIEGEEYTLNFWVRSEVKGKVNAYGKELETDGEWKRFSSVFTADSNQVQLYFNIPGTYYLYNTMLENGNTPSDWRPSPEDTDEEIGRAKLSIDAITEFVNSANSGEKTVINGGAIETDTITAKQININDLFAQEITATGSVTGLKFISRGEDDYSYAAEMVLDAGELHLVAGDGLLDDGTYVYSFNADISAHDIELSYKAPDVLNRIWMNGNLIEHIIGDDSGNRTTVFKSSPEGVEVTSIDISEGITGTKERPLYNGKPLALYSDLN